MKTFKVYKPGKTNGNFHLLDKEKERCKVCNKTKYCKTMYHVVGLTDPSHNPQQVCSKLCADMHILQNM